MAELGPVQFPAQMTLDLHGRPCPTCAAPVTSVLVDAVVNAKPAETPSALGVVEVDVSGVPFRFTFEPCGCMTTPDGTPIPAEPLVSVIARDAETGELLDAEVTVTPLPGAIMWPPESSPRVRRFKGRVVRPRRK